MNKEVLQQLEKKIGYTFQNKQWLVQALTHSSYANEHRLGKLACNERLEFLGDAVLELSVSEFLFAHYSEEPEGVLTKKRASIVCEQTLALCAKQIHLGEYLLLGKGEEVTGGRNRASITSDAFEAVIGAIYRDGGYPSARSFINEKVLTDIENKQLFYDSKTKLQEIVQSMDNCELSYDLVKEEGPDHNKHFQVNAVISGAILGVGNGSTKKAAEQEAAYHAILNLRK